MKRAFTAIAIVLASAACRGSGVGPAVGEETTLEIEGARSLPEEELRTAIARDRFGEAEPRASRAAIDDAAYAVEEAYRQQGYAQVFVDYEHEEDAEGVHARLMVNEGPRILLGEVRFEGNAGIDSATLRRFFDPEGTGQRPFVRAALASATDGIEDYYYGKGWLRAEAQAEASVDRATGRADVVCRVTEGPRYELRDYTLEVRGGAREDGAPGAPGGNGRNGDQGAQDGQGAGGAEPTQEAADVLQDEEGLRRSFAETFAQRRDRPYVPAVGYGLRAVLLEALGNRGHADARVSFDATLDGATGDVHLSYVVEPGPRVTIGEIRIVGASGVRRSSVLDRLEVDPGDLYDRRAVRESFSNLYRSGFFRTVDIQLAPPERSGDTTRDLVVTLDELPSVEIYVEPGYGSYEGPRLSFGAIENNLLGTGTGLQFDTTVGRLAQSASLTWTDPWIADGRFESQVSLFGDHREEPAFTQTEFGTELSLARVWSEELRTTLSYRFRRNLLEDIDLDANDPLLEDALNDVNVASVGLSTTLDDRDALFVPTGGGRVRASVEWATAPLGSEIDFLAGTVEAARFVSLGEKSVLAMRLRTSLKAPIAGTTSIPLQERLFNGGENTVRSFKEDELGPLDSGGKPLGGETATVANVELRQKLFGHLDGALFYDVGNVTSKVDEYLDFPDFKSGLGVGLRYLLPIGPVRLDAGWNPDPDAQEDDFVVHFSIGMAF